MATAPRSPTAASGFIEVTATITHVFAFVLQSGDLRGKAVGDRDVLRGKIARVADGDAPAVHEAARAFSGNGLEADAFPNCSPRCLAFRDDGLGQRMLGFRFNGRREPEQARQRHRASRRKFTMRPSTITSVTRGLPSVSVPVLSKGDDLHRGRAFEMDAAFEQDPRRAAPPIAERMDAGVLMISAQGDATTMTVIAR